MSRRVEYIHVSVAWPYANGDLHVGHLAGTYLPADVFARYHRLRGNHVLMVSGSDSHGTPISVEADRLGLPARQVFEHYHRRFLLTQQKLGISYDLFTHTDTETHHRIARDIFLQLLERDYLYREEQELLYSEREGRFLPDRYVEGGCYLCGYDSARGDQCDNCGNLLDATKLVQPRNRAHPDDSLVVRRSEHYFLDLSRTSTALLDYLARNQAHWRSNVHSFTRNLILRGEAEGLRGRAYTRDLDWGVRVPLPGWEDKCIYVWFEAVNGYFTASVEWAQNEGRPDAWKDWWYNPDAKIYNFIGKDNIPFHTVIWPAMLLGIDGLYHEAGTPALNLPHDVPANEFMNIEGRQFSKSRNWAIWLPDILERYQADAIRYYVAMTFPETQDSDFSWEGFLARVNNELVAAWGNLVNRALNFAWRNFDGAVPQPGPLADSDRAIIARSESGFDEIAELLEQVRLREALQAAMDIARAANAHLQQREPWKSIRTDRVDAATAVYSTLRVIDNLKLLLSPFLPFSAQDLHELLGYDGQLFGTLGIRNVQEKTRAHEALVYNAEHATGAWRKSELPPGQALREPKPLFTRLEPEIVDSERAFLGAAREEREII